MSGRALSRWPCCGFSGGFQNLCADKPPVFWAQRNPMLLVFSGFRDVRRSSREPLVYSSVNLPTFLARIAPAPPTAYKTLLSPKLHPKIHPESSPETKIRKNTKNTKKLRKPPHFRTFFVFWFRVRIRGTDGLPREWWGSKSLVCPSKPRTTNFFAGYPSIFAGIFRGCPKSLRRINLCSILVP